MRSDQCPLPPQPSTSRPFPSAFAPLTAPPLLVPPGSPGHREAARWLLEDVYQLQEPTASAQPLGAR